MSNRVQNTKSNTATTVMRRSPINISSSNNSNNNSSFLPFSSSSSTTQQQQSSNVGNPQDDFHRGLEGDNHEASIPATAAIGTTNRNRYDSYDEEDGNGNMEMTSLLAAHNNTDHGPNGTPVTSHKTLGSIPNIADNNTNKKTATNNRRVKHRNSNHDPSSHHHKKHRRRRTEDTGTSLDSTDHDQPNNNNPISPTNGGAIGCFRNNRLCCCYRSFKSTLQCMNVLARVLLWCTVVALIVAVVWYSYELHNHGTDAHYIAWFSAGAFVLLGFPVSMWGIVGHLAYYNQPSVQVYVVRILWMVPIYSIESWLAMRFHKQAIYIETFRDFYESYVLYSFFQFLIEVLGGEENLILMLKDKSPTRGVHMWGLQWCLKPWLMGQPVRRESSTSIQTIQSSGSSYVQQQQQQQQQLSNSGGSGIGILDIPKCPNNISGGIGDQSSDEDNPVTATLSLMSTQTSATTSTSSTKIVANIVGGGSSTGVGGVVSSGNASFTTTRPRTNRTTSQIKTHRPKKLVIWESPFFKHCKFGVLQYVLLKIICSVAVPILEWKGLYHEGHFDWRYGYFYICFITNLSQCWALYTLIFFYYATKNELSPIRPVPKFISVKALVFFTWWQSVVISCLYQLDMIPNYTDEWTPEHVAKGIQDYLICVEMFVIAVVHVFVFPHSEYSPAAVEARQRAVLQQPSSFYGSEHFGRKRLGRQKYIGQPNRIYTRYWRNNVHDDDVSSKNSNITLLLDDSGAQLSHDEDMIDIECGTTKNDSMITTDGYQSTQADRNNILTRSEEKKYGALPRASSWRQQQQPQSSGNTSRLSVSRFHSNPLVVNTGHDNDAAIAAQTDSIHDRTKIYNNNINDPRTPPRKLSHTYEPNVESPLNYLPSITTFTAGQPLTWKDSSNQNKISTYPIMSSSSWDGEIKYSNNTRKNVLTQQTSVATNKTTSTVPVFRQNNHNSNQITSNVGHGGNNETNDERLYCDYNEGSEYSDGEYDDNEYEDYYDDEFGSSSGSYNDTTKIAPGGGGGLPPPLLPSVDNTGGTQQQRPGFVRALIDSAIPLDLRDNTVGIVKGQYHVEKKSLLHHAATSDQYDLFSNRRRFAKHHQQHQQRLQQQQQQQQEQDQQQQQGQQKEQQL